MSHPIYLSQWDVVGMTMDPLLAAVRSLEFDTVNLARLELVVESYLSGGSMLSIAEGNAREPLTFSFR